MSWSILLRIRGSKIIMDRWRGRVAVVTGASAGIGAAVCRLLANEGMKVVGCARRLEKVEELAKENSNIYPIKVKDNFLHELL